MFRRYAALTGVLLAAGCGDQPAPPVAPFELVLDDHQLMNWVLDPATDVIWGAAGEVITEAGVQDLAPVDQQGWDTVRNAAATVTEAGNLLMLPGRSRGADWDEFARGIVLIGQRAIAAAEARDDQALFDAGGQLYNVCVACHQLYMVDQESGDP